MFTRKILTALFVVSLAFTAHSQAQREQPRPEARGVIKSVSADSITITSEGRDAAGDKTFAIAKNAEVAVSTAGTRIGLLKEAKIIDLNPGVRVVLGLTADQKAVDSILAEGPALRGQLKSLDAAKKTITLEMLPTRDGAGDEKTFTLAADAEIAIDDGRGRRFSVKEGQLADLTPGVFVNAWLSVDLKEVQALLAEGPTLFGTVKAIDASKRTLTLTTQPARGNEAGEERTLTVANNAVILQDDGRGKRLSLKETKLENVPAGSTVAVRLSVDQKVATSLRAEGPSVFGLLKSVDAAKGLITVAVPRARGDEPEVKSLTVAKDARIIIDGAEAPLANLKAGDGGPFVQVRLSLDQNTAQFIMARTQQQR